MASCAGDARAVSYTCLCHGIIIMSSASSRRTKQLRASSNAYVGVKQLPDIAVFASVIALGDAVHAHTFTIYGGLQASRRCSLAMAGVHLLSRYAVSPPLRSYTARQPARTFASVEGPILQPRMSPSISFIDHAHTCTQKGITRRKHMVRCITSVLYRATRV